MNKKIFFLLIISCLYNSFINSSENKSYQEYPPTNEYPHGYALYDDVIYPFLAPEPPLHEAIKKNNTNMFTKLLSDPKIDINQQDHMGNTPLHIALSLQLNNPYFIKELLNHDARINIRNNNGENAQDLAKIHGMDLERMRQVLKELNASSDIKINNNSYLSQFTTWLASLWGSKIQNPYEESNTDYEEDIIDKLMATGGG